MRGVDYSWSRPTGAVLKAAGLSFVCRYIPYLGAGLKGLDITEIADLRANGIAIAVVFETTATRPLDGYAAGRADAELSRAAALGLDLPISQPIFFAVDFDASLGQFPTIAEYFRGACAVLTPARVGIYGKKALLEYIAGLGFARWYWQTTAWSGGELFDGRHLFQEFHENSTVNGSSVDFNETHGDDMGWLWLPEEDTSMTDDELLAIWSGKEEASLDRDTRLVNARYRRDEAAAGRAPSVAELAASAAVAAQNLPPAQAAGLPQHDHVGGKVVLT